MDKETRQDINSLEYWTDLQPRVIAKGLGYKYSEPFVKALSEFVFGLKKQEKEKRRATNGEDGILTMALGVLGAAYFKRIKPPLEKRRKKKEKNKEERKEKRRRERRKKRKKRKKERNKGTSFS